LARDSIEEGNLGRPTHYSVEIAARCQNLIELLVDQAGTDPETVARWRGPLRTTFLLAMSTPMLVLPMERLFKPLLRKAGVADDSGLDKAVGDQVLKTFVDGRPFKDADFYEEQAWSYIDATNAFSVAGEWPGSHCCGRRGACGKHIGMSEKCYFTWRCCLSRCARPAE
jgi:hypothetical protein